MLSGYPNELYDQTLDGWTRYDRKIDNKVSGASKKRKMTEKPRNEETTKEAMKRRRKKDVPKQKSKANSKR